MSDIKQKLYISIGSGLLLMALNSPFAHTITKTTIENCPTYNGRLIHTMIFLVLTFLTMPKLNENTLLKFKYSLYGSLLAFFIFSPELYTFVGKYIHTLDGNCLNNNGLIFHTLLYISALVGVMYLPNK